MWFIRRSRLEEACEGLIGLLLRGGKARVGFSRIWSDLLWGEASRPVPFGPELPFVAANWLNLLTVMSNRPELLFLLSLCPLCLPTHSPSRLTVRPYS